jgi:hypothetical protein
MLEQAIIDFEDLGPDDIEVLRFRSALARLDIRQGHNRGVVEAVESIAGAAERTRDEALVLELLTARGAGLPSVHRPVEAIVMLEGIYRRAVLAGLTEIADRALTNLSVTVADDDLRYGRDVALAGLEEAIARGARSDAAYFASNSAEFDLHLGNLSAALERMERILALELEGGDRSMCLATQTAVSLLMGRPSVAVDEVADAVAGTQVSLDDDMRTWAALVAGDGQAAVRHGLAMARDDELNAPMAFLRAAIGASLAGDAASARAAADELRAHGRWGRAVAACTASTEAIALVLEGNRDAGLTVGRDAIERMRAEGIRLDEGLVLLGLGLALGDEDPGPAFVQRARDRLDDVGAAAVVAMIDERGLLPVDPERLVKGRSVAGQAETNAVSG